MGFLDDFEEGGELHDDAKDALYLNTQSDFDLIGEVSEIKKLEHHDEHDDHPGEEFMILEVELARISEGQGNKKGGVPRDLETGETLSLKFPMYDNVKKSHKTNLFRELREMLGAVSDTREAEVGEDVRKFVSDAAKGEFNGNYVRILSKPPNEKGYRNIQVIAFDEDDLD